MNRCQNRHCTIDHVGEPEPQIWAITGTTYSGGVTYTTIAHDQCQATGMLRSRLLRAFGIIRDHSPHAEENKHIDYRMFREAKALMEGFGHLTSKEMQDMFQAQASESVSIL
jgi:hypothetical protein